MTTFDNIEDAAVKAFQSKQFWLDTAEVFDAWRIVPRSVLYGMGLLTWRVVMRCLDWFTNLPATQRSYEEAGAAVLIIGAVTTVFKYALDSYMNSGRQWTRGQ